MKRIIYKNTDNSIAILIPTEEAIKAYGIEAIAKKDTPVGLPYWIVDTIIIPTDRTDRDAWELSVDMSAPDGYGSDSSAFTEEVLPCLK